MLLGLFLIIVALVMLQDSVIKDEVDPPHIKDYKPKPKLAFMFLTRHVMPLDILWQHFFEVPLFDESVVVDLLMVVSC